MIQHYQELICWLLAFNTLPFLCLALSYKKTENTGLYYSFLAMLILGLCWGNSIYLYRSEIIPSPETRLFLIHLNFASGVACLMAFGFFTCYLTGRTDRLKSVLFIALQGYGLGLSIFSFFGFGVEGYRLTPDLSMQLNYGPGHLLYIVAGLLIGGYSLWILLNAYKNAEDDLLKFQIGLLFKYGGLAFVATLTSNGLIPYFWNRSDFSQLGPIWAELFLVAAFRILWFGQSLHTEHLFKKIIRSSAMGSEGNAQAMRELVGTLKNVLGHRPNTFKKRVAFFSDSQAYQITLTNQDHNSEPNTLASASQVPEKKWMGLLHDLHRLQHHNRMLALQVLERENTEPDQLAQGQRNRGVYSNQEYMPIVREIIEQNRADFGDRVVVAFSSEMLQVVAQVKAYAKSQSPVVFIGEVGTGRKTMAQAMHYYRGGRRLEIINAKHSIGTIRRRIKSLSRSWLRQADGLLITNIEKLSAEHSAYLSELAEKKPVDYLYFTRTVSCSGDKVAGTRGAEDRAEAGLAAGAGRSTAPNAVLAPWDSSGFHAIDINLAPLRQRPEDILYLLFYYSAKIAANYGLTNLGFGNECMQRALGHHWSGNTGELIACLEKSLLVSTTPYLDKVIGLPRPRPALEDHSLTPLELSERAVIQRYLEMNHFNKNRTRKDLGISTNTLAAKIKRYAIVVPK